MDSFVGLGSIVVETEKFVVSDECFISCDVETGEIVTFVIVTDFGPADTVVLFDELESMALVLSVALIIVVVDDGEDLSIVPDVVVYCDEFRDERMEVFMTVSVDDTVGAIVTCEAGDTDDLLEVAVEIMACFVESC